MPLDTPLYVHFTTDCGSRIDVVSDSLTLSVASLPLFHIVRNEKKCALVLFVCEATTKTQAFIVALGLQTATKIMLLQVLGNFSVQVPGYPGTQVTGTGLI